MCLCQQNLDELRIVDAGQLWGKEFGTCPTLSVFIAEFDQLRKILPVIACSLYLAAVRGSRATRAVVVGEILEAVAT
ncbi:unnamed protein product [Sphagnum jensenii]|uniref:Uncharacterized protein n=1 Tax=Sphagnum jensenii TaxID=128206 RepID=A0ABP1AUJ2_9BRYO